MNRNNNMEQNSPTSNQPAKTDCRACLYIIRGLPGSGKSTLARRLVPESRHREADMYHMTEHGYVWRKENAGKAHKWCFDEVERLMKEKTADIAISNTFTRKWEYAPYLKLASVYGYKPVVIDCYADFGNIHNVPKKTIENMRIRFEPYYLCRHI